MKNVNNLNKRIAGILILLIFLYFTAMSQHKLFLTNLNTWRIPVEDYLEQRKQAKEKEKSEEEQVKDQSLPEVETKSLNLYAGAAVLTDAESGRVLYEKNGYKEVAMASTTKIMTCIIALENGNLSDKVTISKYAATMPDVQLNVRSGEQYLLKDLLYSLMLESHNDVAVAIAEHVGGSVEGFAKMMNKKAKELGCEHTNFVTPNGLDATNHHTTAVELAKIAAYAIKNKEFIEITNTSSWQFNELTKGRGFTVNNKDRFLSLYNGAIGIKTGFTNKAGYCFVGAVKRKDKTLISVVLGSGWPPNKSYKWKDTTALMDYGVKNFEKKQIFNADKEFEPAFVKNGQENFVELYYEGSIELLMKKDDIVKVEYKIPTVIKAPIGVDTVVGSAKYYVNGELIQEFPILTAGEVLKIDLKFCIDKVVDLWMGR
ncbi:MAG: D-alanyl-D-alanine carboxypeptidase family protein [Anaerocolumna sp.]